MRKKRINNPLGYAYEQMLEQLNEYLPVIDYANQVVTRADLAEMGLITGEGLDVELRTDLKTERLGERK